MMDDVGAETRGVGRRLSTKILPPTAHQAQTASNLNLAMAVI